MQIYTWLFETQYGMYTLVLGGMALFAIIALIAERKTHNLYVDHSLDENGQLTEGEDEGLFGGLFNDDEDDNEDTDQGLFDDADDDED